MYKKIAKIQSTFLGIEDHGIFTSIVDVTYGSSGQGIGTYSLDTWDATKNKRVGTAFGAEFILRTLKTVGVDSWEKLVGKTIFVLIESEDFGATVLGIESLPTEGVRTFLFKDLVDELGI